MGPEEALLLTCHFALVHASMEAHFVWGIPADFCHKTLQSGNFHCENIYIWKSDQDDFISLLNVTLARPGRSDLRALAGRTVTVIADNMRPYILSSNRSQQLSGYLGDIWSIVQEALNFESSLISVNYDTGLEIISNGNADVMLGAGVVKPGLVGVEYSQPYLHNWYHLYIKKPEATASSSSYIKTLSRGLWIASSVMFSMLALALYFTIKFLHSTFRLEPRVSLPSCLLSVCSGFLNQGFDLRLSSCTGRILIFFSLIPGYMLYSAINAVLVAKLAILTVELPFKSIDDVRTERKLSMCLRSNSFVYNNFTYRVEANRIVLPEWNGILNGPGCLNINDQANLAQILCRDGIVILENRVVMATVVQNFPIRCDISNLNERYFPQGNSYLIRKGFIGKRPIEAFIKHMRATGVLRRLEDKWMRREISARSDSTQQLQIPQVTFNHISGIVTVYASMILASLAVLGIELIVNRFQITTSAVSVK